MQKALEQVVNELIKRVDVLEGQDQEQPPKNKVVMFRIRNFKEFKKIIEIVELQIQSLQESLKILKDYDFEIENVTIPSTQKDKVKS